MMFAKEAEALAYAEPLVPKRFHTWLRCLTRRMGGLPILACWRWCGCTYADRV
jgi:hypothetical protein